MITANAAAIKTFVANRIGDFGFLAGIFAALLLILVRFRDEFGIAARNSPKRQLFQSNAQTRQADVQSKSIQLEARP